jgi:hypothetical protein
LVSAGAAGAGCTGASALGDSGEAGCAGCSCFLHPLKIMDAAINAIIPAEHLFFNVMQILRQSFSMLRLAIQFPADPLNSAH